MGEETIKTKKAKISRDKKQTKVAIPAEFVEEIEINPDTDKIIWNLLKDKEGYTLIGILERG